MGVLLLIYRLVARDLRRQPVQAVLLLIAITAATTTLTLGLVLHGVVSQPYQQTQAATNGPDIVAYLPVPTSASTKASLLKPPSQTAGLISMPGVTRHSGPYAIVSATVQANGRSAGTIAEARDQAPAAVDQPKLTEGSWVRSGGIVVERAFASALGVSVGQQITLNGRPFKVVGIAVTAAHPPYPGLCLTQGGGCAYGGDFPPNDRGLIWMQQADAVSLVTPSNPVYDYILDLKLAHPASAQALANQYDSTHTDSDSPSLAAWQGIADADGIVVQGAQQVLQPGSWLIALLALASVAVLAGGRLTEQTRRVGLIKAIGGTPALIGVILLAENLLLALLAAVIGLIAGRFTAPLLTNPGSALIGTPGAPLLTGSDVGLVIVVAFLVALAATLVPTIRAARTSTVSALNNAARAPRRSAWLIAISAWLPVSLLLGLRLTARRPRRALLSAASIMVTVTAIVAVLAFHASVGAEAYGAGTGLDNPVTARVSQVMLVLTVILGTLAVLNTIFTAWTTVLDVRRASALSRALGVTPEQLTVGLSAAQVLPALPGALLGIPLGIGLFKVANGGGLTEIPPISWLVATVLGTLLAVALLTSIPARIDARRPAGEILQSEAV